MMWLFRLLFAGTWGSILFSAGLLLVIVGYMIVTGYSELLVKIAAFPAAYHIVVDVIRFRDWRFRRRQDAELAEREKADRRRRGLRT